MVSLINDDQVKIVRSWEIGTIWSDKRVWQRHEHLGLCRGLPSRAASGDLVNAGLAIAGTNCSGGEEICLGTELSRDLLPKWLARHQDQRAGCLSKVGQPESYRSLS